MGIDKRTERQTLCPAVMTRVRQVHRQWCGVGFWWAIAPLVLSGCGLPLSLPGFMDTPVQLADVNGGDRYDEGAVVQVSGTVGDRVPLVDAQIYQLQDETGSVWVLTTDTSIQSGDRLTVEGRVEIEVIELGNNTMQERYLREIEQVER